jgi:type III secretion protein J
LARTTLLLPCVLLMAGCRVDLYSQVEEQQANRMTSELARHDIDVRKESVKDGMFTLRVPRSDFARSMAILEAAGMPDQKHASLTEVFEGGGLVSTPTQERARLMHAIAGELSQTIGTIDGIINARVHVVLPESDPLRRNIVPSSAAVFVRHSPRAPINPLVPQIKKLVADSVAGLDYDRVSVIAVPANPGAFETAPAPHGASVLGIRVEPGSVTRAISIFAVLVAALLAMAAALFLLTRKLRKRMDFAVRLADHDHA